MTFRSWTAGVVLLGALAAGAVVNRAALRGTLDLDDFAQRAMIEGTLTPRRGPFNLYDLIADDNRTALLDRGVIPWWSDPHLTIRFLRPLPSLLVWMDHRLFGNRAFGPHLLSFLWWAAAVLAAHLLYRTATTKQAAWIATTVFALSPALAIPLVWLANRSILVSLTFGALALALYVRWRNDGRRALGLATAGAFGAAALTGEYALCLFGYLLAFELCRCAEPLRRRLTGVLPAVGPLLLYAAARAALGYGTAGTGFYRDPTTDPGTYLQALPRTFSALLASTWLGADVTAPWLASQFLQTMLIVGAGVLIVGTVWGVRREWSGTMLGGGSWLACGSIVALLPLAATEPSRRLLGVAALGVSGAVGLLLEKGMGKLRPPVRPSFMIGVAALAGSIHLALAPFQTRRLSFDAVEDQVQNLARFATVPQRARSVDTALVVRANYGLTVLSAPFLLREDAPKHWVVLSHTFEQTAAVRTSVSSVEVVQESAPLFPLGPTGIVRTAPFRAGDVVETAVLRATILRIDEAGRPLAVRYELNRDLDSADVAWISEGRSGFSEVVPPPVGIGVRLAP
jgi:hypothetical protein